MARNSTATAAAALPRMMAFVREDLGETREVVLASMRDAYQTAERAFHATIAAEFPGLGETEWMRAHNHLDGTPFRRNDDTSNDAALVASATIQAAWDAYMRDLHAFYRFRDGPNGVLGGRGL